MKHLDGGLVQTVTVSFRIFVVPLNLNAVCNKAFKRFDQSYFASTVVPRRQFVRVDDMPLRLTSVVSPGGVLVDALLLP